VRQLSELRIADAYIAGDLDVEGDFHRMMELRPAMRDVEPLIWAWAWLQPRLLGRRLSNPGWIHRHYDIGNVQLLAIDHDYQTYTPGDYERDDDSLEVGAERKLARAFEALGLKPGDSLLEVGCGWGGFTRYCARRGVSVTGITLSHDQLAFALDALAAEGLSADLRYKDFFTFQPGRTFDAISVMGVIEDLSEYRRVFRRLSRWLRPGGRIYLDFAAADHRFGIASFITKYVWPGAFRLVYMPQFLAALSEFKLDVELLETDRRNYHLWTKKGHDRFVERHDEVVAAADERTFRTLRLLYAGCAWIFGPTTTKATAYRVVVQARRDAFSEPVVGPVNGALAALERRGADRMGVAPVE
jgi:cyclopropane-fatty-acyl-phospholipid synthase